MSCRVAASGARWLIALVIAAGSVGCAGIDTVECADGFACPDGTTCDVENRRCLTDEQIAECVDKAEGDACEYAAGDGFCHLDACIIPVCGNGVLEPTEACDDGNTEPLDGCAFDCRSDETCGNGVADLLLGEACDDGNALSHDGCGVGCQLEVPTWTRVPPNPPHILIGQHPEMAFDAARGRVVLAGLSETWEWDGTAWNDRTPVGASPNFIDAPVAYHADRQRVVVVGRQVAGAPMETWEWNGEAWTDVSSDPGPAPVSFHAATYSAALRSVVVVGGRLDAGGVTGQTWSWDGAGWTEHTTGPSGRKNHALAYDFARDRVVLFGGDTSADDQVQTRVADTWEWDGTQWLEVTPAGASPPARADHSMVYDPVRGTTLLFGGRDAAGTRLGDTWEWDGATWTPIVGPGPGTRHSAGMTFDLARGEALLFGGELLLTDTWRFRGGAWVNAPLQRPSNRTDHELAYDPLRGRVVLVGSVTGGDPEPWEWTGQGWIDATPAAGPSPVERRGHAMVFDQNSGQILLHGGRDAGDALLDDAWLWDGATWTAAASGPAAIADHAMTLDTLRERVVLLGDDTWEWDGAGWQRVADAASSPGRTGHAMGFDAASGRSVVFGGDGFSDDTWEWDGSAWVDVDVASPPLVRANARAAYDPSRGELLLFGGNAPGISLGDMWSYAAGVWREVIATSTTPGKQSRHAIAYDAIRQELLMVLPGSPASGPVEVWRFQYRTPRAPREVCQYGVDVDGDGLVGCDDPDCWGSCTPLCPPGQSCAAAAGCGDGVCGELETCRMCPEDCGACDLCGDYFCDPSESAQTCPGDCS